MLVFTAFAQLFAEVHVGMDIQFHHREIFEFTHLKFTISGRSKQTSIDIPVHTRMRNAVMLVWGSLRLAPIMCFTCDRFNNFIHVK